MKIVDVSQGSPEWHAWRKAGVTASDAVVLIGSPYKTPHRLWAEKTGRVNEPDLSGNPHVQRGLREEPLARRSFEDRHGVLLLPVCAESTAEPILRASLDGLTDAGVPVELKAPGPLRFADAVANREQSALYRLYHAQVQTQIFVAGAEKAWISLYHDGQALDLEVPRDDECIARIVERAREFWAHVERGTEPPLDPERDLYVPSGPDLEAWKRLAAEYRQLDEKLAVYGAEIEALKKRQARMEKELLGLMGDFPLAECSGLRIARSLAKGAIDYRAAVQALLPAVAPEDLERFRRPPSERVRITVRADADRRTEVPFEADALKALAGPDNWF